MQSKTHLKHIGTLTVIALMLSACSDSNDSPTPVNDAPTVGVDPTPGGGASETPDASGFINLSVDASAGGFTAGPDDPANRWAYLDLDTGTLLDMDDATALTSPDWEIAFKRVAVKLNGGVSGAGSTLGGIADAQLGFYDDNNEPLTDAFVAASADTQVQALVRPVAVDQIEFVTDSEVASIKGDGFDVEASWWIYDPAAFSVTANPAARYMVRGANGDSYAKMRVTDIQQAERQISIEFNLQGPDAQTIDDAPVTWIASIGSAGGSLCYDFDTQQQVDCEGAAETWDIQAAVSPEGRTWDLWTNGGVRGEGGAGASFGPLTESMLAAFSNANDVPVWTADSTGGVFNDYSWYAYNLQENNRIWPNYRVYAIDNGENAWKLQVLRYYDDAGVSGMLGVRYGEITAGTTP